MSAMVEVMTVQYSVLTVLKLPFEKAAVLTFQHLWFVGYGVREKLQRICLGDPHRRLWAVKYLTISQHVQLQRPRLYSIEFFKWSLVLFADQAALLKKYLRTWKTSLMDIAGITGFWLNGQLFAHVLSLCVCLEWKRQFGDWSWPSRSESTCPIESIFKT